MSGHLMDLAVWELRDLVQARRVTPTTIMDACLQRIREREEAVGAFQHIAWDYAVTEAAIQTTAMERGNIMPPLAGIPIAVKDLEDVAGMPTTRGMRPIPSSAATEDSIQVARLRKAGAIVVGKTKTPADGHIAVTKNLLGPPARNPWGLDRSPGGSSGGSAAAVAARMVPWATSSDGGGSIRIPASLVGCFGVKPTRGLIPMPPARGGVQSWLRVSVVGPTTRCVRDAAIYLDVTAGYDGRDADSIVRTPSSLVPKSYEAAIARALSQNVLAPMRTAVVRFAAELLPGIPVQPDLRVCFDACAERIRTLLGELGTTVHKRELSAEDISLPAFGDEWTLAVGAYRLARFDRQGLTRPEHAAQLDRSITALWPSIRRNFSIDATGEVFAKIAANNESLANVFRQCDLLVTPSLGLEAYPARGPPSFVAMGKTDTANEVFQVMMPFNYSGHPAIVLRAGLSESGMPCAVQVVADRGQEELLLQFAALYERRFGCFDAWPSWPFRPVAGSGAAVPTVSPSNASADPPSASGGGRSRL
eukprot:m.350547 g.350547  ORF g.350547 m.350547 type:complete len:534 (-) comp20693_c0_seq9:1116-2717(-)